MCLFRFNQDDLTAACNDLRSSQARFRFKTDRQLVMELPLRTWNSTVRREYLQPEEQLSNLQAWYARYIKDPLRFIDATIPAKPRSLVRGGKEGLAKFEACLTNQLVLVRKGMLSGEQADLGAAPGLFCASVLCCQGCWAGLGWPMLCSAGLCCAPGAAGLGRASTHCLLLPPAAAAASARHPRPTRPADVHRDWQDQAGPDKVALHTRQLQERGRQPGPGAQHAHYSPDERGHSCRLVQ